MNLKTIAGLLFCLLASTQMCAQQIWTLEECVDYALEHNLQIKEYGYASASNKETYRQSVRDVLPRINGFSNYNVRYGRSVDPNDNAIVNTEFFSNNYSLESSIDLFRGFQKLNTIKASKLLFKAMQEETLQQRYLLAFRVMKAFYDIQFFKGLVIISNEQLQVSQSNYDLVKKQVALGLKAGSDVYDAESILLTDKLNVTQSQNQLALAKLGLIQEMNLKHTTDIQTLTVSETKTVATESQVVLQVDSVYSEARAFVPLLKSQELRTKAAKKQVDAARGNLYPSVSLFGGVGTGYYQTTRDSLGITIPFNDQFRDNTFKYIGVSLNVPIFTAWTSRSAIKQQKIAQLREQNNLEIQEQELQKTIGELVQEYNSLVVEHEQSNSKLEAQGLAFTIAQKKYEKGLINALDLFTAKNLFANAQNENLQVRLRKEINKSTLDFYRGLPVFNIEGRY